MKVCDNKKRILEIETLVKNKNLSNYFVIAIDGPCAGGKTTFAEEMNKGYEYNIVHMDDFYLPFQKRDKNWMNIIAGHMDFDRLIEKVLKPYKERREIEYISYDCHSDKYLQKIDIDLDKPVILEGSYSTHPILDNYIDIKIYLDIDSKTQVERLTKRNEKVVDKFVSMWIPFENNYFEKLNIKEKCDLVFNEKKLILASKSARRKEILEKEGYEFDIFVSSKEENSIIGKKYSLELVENCAIEKAKNAYEEIKESNALIVSCDTVVVIDDVIIGKPKDREDAIRILSNLSGKTHQVISAVAVINDGVIKQGYEVSNVTFRKVSKEEIEEYIDRCKPYDKAGSYGIQDEGFNFVENVGGNIDNVIGLPIKTLKELLD